MIRDFENFSKLRTAIYPSNMARTAAKLWENAFQMIPDVSFFDAENKMFYDFFLKISGVKSKTSRFGGATNF